MIDKTVKNATILPQIYYGLHMVPGVAEYTKEQGGRIFIDEPACKNMDPTFTGKPVYVMHVDEVDLAKLQEEADGYVIESFFNKCDGKHWAKFIIVSDEGHAAIAQGWKLSNAYLPLENAGGGKWHNVDYVREVTRGEYEHLAVVPNPRYEESIILTPEQFKAYNAEKELELQRLSNSNDEREKSTMKFNIFKKTKLENSAELESATVTLSTGKELTIQQLVNAAEESEKETKMNMDSKVKVDDEELSMNEVVEKYKALKAAKKNADDEAAKKEAEEKKKNEEMSEEDKKKKNAEDKEKEEAAKKNADEEAAKKKKDEEEKKQNALHFEKLKNAHDAEVAATPVETSVDQVARGKTRYGSN